LWRSKRKYNALCYQAVSNEPFTSWRIPEDNSISLLEKKIRNRVLKVSISFNPLPLIVIENMGNVPIENAQRTSGEFQQGNEAFFSNPPNLDTALELYQKALEKAFTADTCNMIGRCLQLKGKTLLAIPFYRQAVSLDPEHPYAGANLASCLWEVGEKKQARNTAHSALKNPNLSDWGRKQINTLEF
jgi:tetratricopeptide (TPR) repeat protein